MESVALTIVLVLFGLFTVLLIALSVSEARQGKKVEREQVRAHKVIQFRKSA